MAAKPLNQEQLADAERLKSIFDRQKAEGKGLSQEALAHECGWKTQGAVNQYFTGKIPLNLPALLKFSKALSVRPEEISPTLASQVRELENASKGGARSESNIEPGPDFRNNRKYPVISWVQAGEWTTLCDNFEPGDADDWRPCHRDLGRCGYILRVKGESMTATGAQYTFPEGIMLYVNPDIEALPGKFVIVRRENGKEATFKRLVLIEDEPYLEAINPDWPQRYLKMQAGDTICGVVMHAGFDMP